jgi:hypothetical protein
MNAQTLPTDCETTSLLSRGTLQSENAKFRGTGGVSQNNRSFGFEPGFLDVATGIAYRSRFGDGSPAPVHVLDGLPGALVTARDTEGRVSGVKATVISGFLRGAQFLTREEAAKATRADS